MGFEDCRKCTGLFMMNCVRLVEERKMGSGARNWAWSSGVFHLYPYMNCAESRVFERVVLLGKVLNQVRRFEGILASPG